VTAGISHEDAAASFEPLRPKPMSVGSACALIPRRCVSAVYATGTLVFRAGSINSGLGPDSRLCM